MTSMRLPASTSLTSWIERSWPIASGVSVSGRGTASRSGRTGSVAGSSRWPPTWTSRPSSPASTSITGPRPPRARLALAVLARDLDRDRPRLGPLQRQLDAQDPVAVGRRGGLRDDVGAERDRAPERAEVDLELLVDAALGVGGAAVAGEDELAALDVEGDLVGVDARQLRHDDRARRVALVEDVDAPGRSRRGRGERGRRRRRRRRTARPSAAASARSSRRGRAPGAWPQSRSTPRRAAAGRGVRPRRRRPRGATSTAPVEGARRLRPHPRLVEGRRDVRDDEARDARALGRARRPARA